MRIDLHTHSILSPDGSISAKQYESVLKSGKLDCVAITDHNRIDFAVELQKKLGDQKIIVGEEISTQQGEVIGLFLDSPINGGEDIRGTITNIKNQGGLVYIPHPFETVRSGISQEVLDEIADDVDIIEINNGRAFFQNFSDRASEWAQKNGVAAFSSSDAHRAGALDKTYTELTSIPDRESLLGLTAEAGHKYRKPSFLDIIAPKFNRFMGRFMGKKK